MSGLSFSIHVSVLTLCAVGFTALLFFAVTT